jgi:hypothetical protein
MINVEDLRIGDIVQTNKDCMFPKDTLCIVTEIHPDRQHNDKKGVVSLKAVNDEDDGPWGTWCCNIDGVPITPEILKKNGFKEEIVGKYSSKPLDNEEYIFARYLAVERKSGNWVVFIKYRRLHENALLRKIQHVHELQHILWVLGLDAELKL